MTITHCSIFDEGHEGQDTDDGATRWGSTYNMIVSLKIAKDVLIKIEPVKNKSMDENFELNEEFWDFVGASSVAFEPLQCTIVKFQQEHLHTRALMETFMRNGLSARYAQRNYWRRRIRTAKKWLRAY